MPKFIFYIKELLFSIVCLLSLQGFFLESVKYHFQYLTTNEGLPQNTVDCMFLDSRGFMWFGTWNGLCRYDGYSFVTFQNGMYPADLPDNFIRTICEDDNGRLWIGTSKGLSCFDIGQEQFLLPDTLKSCFEDTAISEIKKDGKGNIWMATDKDGLWYFPTVGPESFIPVKIDEKLLPDHHLNSVCVVHDNLILAGTQTGMGWVTPNETAVTSAFLPLIRTLEGFNIQTIFETKEGEIWTGTDRGLCFFNPRTREIHFYNPEPANPYGLSHGTVTCITEDINGQIIIGTLNGLNYFDPGTSRFYHISENQVNGENLNNPFVNSILSDKQGNVWIGTDKGGVNYYNIYQKPFKSLRNQPGNSNSLSHNTVNSILKEPGVLWIGTAGGGLNRITEGMRTVESLQATGAPGLNSNFISSLFRDSKGNLWIGSWGGGLHRLIDFKKNTFELFLNNPANPGSLVSNFISSMTETVSGKLIIGTLSGLDVFDPGSRHFYHPSITPSVQEESPQVGCLLFDRNKNLWVGTRNKGLIRIDSLSLERFLTAGTPVISHVYANNSSDSLSLPGNYVISLYEDKKGTLWIGTYGNGICKFISDGNKEQFSRYTDRDGLCNNVAYSIEEDHQGNLWISTDKGLSEFDPLTGKFRNFFREDGLLSDQFYWSASEKGEDGTLYFGGVNGLNYFQPEAIILYPYSGKPALVGFSIYNNKVNTGDKYHSHTVLKKSILLTDQVDLSWRDAVFSIEFSALDFFLPEKIQYAYQLEGVDQDWIIVPANRRFANYSGLSGGEYLFRVKATNSDCVWSDKITELRIIVHPPFYKTIWFRILMGLLLILGVLSYIRFRTQYLLRLKNILEQQVSERTKKIEEQKLKLEEQKRILINTNEQLGERQTLIEGQKAELEKQNEKISQQRDKLIKLNEKVNLINQLKLRFFTNISHEFRTPLTLIIDPIEKLLKKYKGDDEASFSLKMINRNAQRLLHLINQLIYFRRLESGKMNLKIRKGNLKKFVRKIFESFKDLADRQQITYELEEETPLFETWFDGDKLENILYNLLSNAFKFTPKKGSISLQMKIQKIAADGKPVPPFAEFRIIDSGKGISENDLDFIFDRFYQVESDQKNAGMRGSGIGLALTFELVQALHGTIEVQSKPGEGSKFLVSLPVTTDCYREDEIERHEPQAEVDLEAQVEMVTQEMVHNDNECPDEFYRVNSKENPLILVVEDNYDLRIFLIKTFRNNYRVIGAENGKEALMMARRYSPDLVISDVMMPEMDGLELCSTLKKDIRTSHIPVILLTARNLIENWIEGLESGADDYIPKPFNIQLLSARIRNLIESRRKLKKLFATPGGEISRELATNKIDNEFIRKVYEVLEINYKNPDFTAENFAQSMFMSRSLLFKKLKVLTDLNINNFITVFRLKKAFALIQEKRMNITEISWETGFNDPKYFSRIFRRFYGSSPTVFSEN